MRDRLADFQKSIDHFDEVELGVPRPASASRLDDRIQDVRTALDSLASEVQSLQRKQQHILSLTVADPRDKDVLEDQISTIRRRTGDLRKAVKEIDEEFVQFTRVAQSNAEVRIRKNQIDLLRRKMGDVMQSFNDTHADYRSRVSVRVRRTLQAVGETVTDGELDQIMDGNADRLFFREMNPLSVSGRAALEDVKQRHNEIQELERSIDIMQEIFIDMQHLVEMQGEVVDSIEKNVENTTGYVQHGAGNVKRAVEYKKSAMRKKICVISTCVLIILILIAVAIILGVVLSSNGRRMDPRPNPRPADN